MGREGQLRQGVRSAPQGFAWGALCPAAARCAGGGALSRDACEIPAPSLAAPCAGEVRAGDFPGAILPLHQTALSAVGMNRAYGIFFLPDALMCIWSMTPARDG